MSNQVNADTDAGAEFKTAETPEEARKNRGFVTIFEQTKDTAFREAGDRSIRLGYHPDRQHILDEDEEDFVAVAVPLAHIELHEPIQEDELGEWLKSDVAQLALERYFPGLQPDEVATEWGAERGLCVADSTDADKSTNE